MKALLLLGMQVDLLPGGPAEVPDSHKLVSVINAISTNYDWVVSANFELPADHLMFAANHLWKRPGQSIQVNGYPTLLHPIFCVPGSFGAEWIPGLNVEKISFTAKMGTDRQTPPHSGFFDVGKKRDTGLTNFLLQHQIKEIHLAGMPLDGEVLHTALDGTSLGFEVKLLVDACKGRSEAAVNGSLQLAKTAGITLIAS